MKKIFSVFILLIVLVTFCTACGKTSDGAQNKTDQTSTGAAVTSASLNSTDSGVKASDSAVASKEEKEKNGGGTSAETKRTKAKSDSAKKNTGDPSNDSSSNTNAGSSKITCYFGIDCRTLYKKDPDKANEYSEGGVILSQTTLKLEKDASVYDALKASGIDFVEGSPGFITSIHSLGILKGYGGSGWQFNINGTYVMKSCKKAILKDGDRVQWRFTCNGGSDL